MYFAPCMSQFLRLNPFHLAEGRGQAIFNMTSLSLAARQLWDELQDFATKGLRLKQPPVNWTLQVLFIPFLTEKPGNAQERDEIDPRFLTTLGNAIVPVIWATKVLISLGRYFPGHFLLKEQGCQFWTPVYCKDPSDDHVLATHRVFAHAVLSVWNAFPSPLSLFNPAHHL